MKLKTIHRKRLEKLIAFLRQLPRKRFNFAIVRNEPPKCGAVGCAIGYLPNVFPRTLCSFVDPCADQELVAKGEDWTHNVGLRSEGIASFESAAVWVCGLPWGEAGWLFTPHRQDRVHDALPILSAGATPKQVARMLEKFIKLHS